MVAREKLAHINFTDEEIQFVIREACENHKYSSNQRKAIDGSDSFQGYFSEAVLKKSITRLSNGEYTWELIKQLLRFREEHANAFLTRRALEELLGKKDDLNESELLNWIVNVLIDFINQEFSK